MKRFKNILCVVEPDSSSNAAVINAINLAKDHQAHLSFVAVVNETGIFSAIGKSKEELEYAFNKVMKNKEKELKSFLSNYDIKMDSHVKMLVGIDFNEVIHLVIRNSHDLVVKCCSNLSWLERIFGSNDMHLLRKCPCPVLMLKEEQVEPCLNILATIDLTEDEVVTNDASRVQEQLNQKVMEYSVAASLADSTTLHIGSVWNVFGEDYLRYGAFSHTPEEKVDQYVQETQFEYTQKLDNFIKATSSRLGKETVDFTNPKVHLVKGIPEKEIPIMVKKYGIDLIVMGTIARTGIPGLFMGNTAESILEQVQCSVLAIKPDGFISPLVLSD